MSTPAVLLQEDSPLGNMQAVVEDDGEVVYFYLNYKNPPGGSQPTRACWVRNRKPPKPSIERERMQQGLPPNLPAEYCRRPVVTSALEADDLRVIWLEEGNGAVLCENDEILAIIPPWSGEGGFDGYARDCVGHSPIAWELPGGPDFYERIERAQEFWNLWEDEQFWDRYRKSLLAPLESVLGRHAKHYAIDGGNWPPRSLVRFDLPDHYVLCTLGVSLLPMPNVDRYHDGPAPFRRIELAAALDRRIPEAEVSRLGSYISGQAGYPWNHWTWFGDGHTIPCDSTPRSANGTAFPAVLLSKSPPGAPAIGWAPYRGDPINLLWMVPITDKERQLAIDSGSPALCQQMAKSKRTYVYRGG